MSTKSGAKSEVAASEATFALTVMKLSPAAKPENDAETVATPSASVEAETVFAAVAVSPFLMLWPPTEITASVSA